MAFPISRRHLLKTAACGFGQLALAGIAGAAAQHPLASKPPMHPARAKRVIFLFMQGGPSQVDTFDYKPALTKWDGKKTEFAHRGSTQPMKVMQHLWAFRHHGDCGQHVSSLFPEVARHVDDLCFLHGMHTEGVAHGPATLFLHTGASNLVRPSMGAWISYGLGSENENLPAFVTVNPPANKGGPRNYSNAFLPPIHQGTVLGQPGNRDAEARLANLASPVSRAASRKQYNFLQRLNRIQAGSQPDATVEGAINSLEMAWRMQNHAHSLRDLGQATQATHELYGIGQKPTDSFGRQCLVARQLAEAGVRYIQINHCDNTPAPVWDQHGNMPRHQELALEVDKPIAGLLTDLKQRGLLDDTLVWWGSEFGRTPFAQGADGRDHNPKGFTTWLAGGGVKRGIAHGATDELGFAAVAGKVHMHDLHATILHLLGLDHEQLTYRYSGRDFRLTDVAGSVVHEIIA